MSKNKNWEVTMQCTVRKLVYCENCTREEAEKDTWEYATDEREIEQIDWEVESITENN